MPEGQKIIEHLFLIRDELEYQIAYDFIQSAQLENYAVLTISDEFPYCLNKYANIKYIAKWEEYGVPDLNLSRGWLNKYKQIEEVVAIDMIKIKKYDNKIIKSPYFTLGVIKDFGRNYYDVIKTLNNFFTKNKFEYIYFNLSEFFFTHLLLSFVKLHKIDHRTLTK